MQHIISRAEWGAAPWRTTVYAVPDTERTEFFVHYHGGVPRHAVGVGVPRTVEDIHLDNGWAGTGYNFMVDQAGTIYEGRGWALVGAHCPNHNRSGWGVYVAIGGDQRPTPAALSAVRGLYDEGCRRAGFALAQKGHRDGKSTACPGEHLYAWVRAGMPGGDVRPSAPVPAAPARPLTDPVLRKGSRGRHAEALQRQLLALGYPLPRFGADGDFGDETDAAVRVLQKATGLAVDGIVGPDTRAVLARGVRLAPRPKPAPAVPPYPGLTRQGSRGGATRAFQQRLKDRGWSIAVDGVHGPATTATLRAFQRDKGLADDGVGGLDTWRALWTAPIT